MKLKNLLYLLLAAPLFVACDPVEEALEPVLTLTSEAEVNFTAEGGEGVITYTLENPVEGTKLEASCEAEWVSNLTAGECVTYTVAANEGEARESKVVVTYGAQSLEVAVKQAAKDVASEEPEPEPEPEVPAGVTFTAYHFDGEYYGTQWSDAHNYYVHLSDNGYDEEGYAYAASTYYTLDIYGVEGVTDEDGYITVPVGTYTLDATSSMVAGTIANDYSSYAVINAEGTAYEVQAKYTEATLVVSEHGAVLTAVINGETHTVTYVGEVKIANTTYGGGETPDVPEGETVEVSVNYAYGYYYGDYYTPGLSNNFYFYLSDKGLDADGFDIPGGAYYRFDIYAPITEVEGGYAVPAGTYEFDIDDTCAPWTFGSYYSAYYKWNSYGDDYDAVDWPAGGYITFKEDGTIEAEMLMLSTGDLHKITFAGSEIVIYEGETGGDDWGDDDWGDDWEGPYSTLLSDYTCDFSDHTLLFVYYGDYYEVGNRNWMVSLMPNSKVGDFVQFDLLGDENSTTNFSGNYTIVDSFGSFTALTGTIEYGYFAGSWYYTEDGYTMAPFVEGNVNIVDGGDGTASLEFTAYDDLGNTVTGSWSGPAVAYEEPSYAPSIAAEKPAKAVKKVAKAPKAEVKSVKKEHLELKVLAPAVKTLSLRK